MMTEKDYRGFKQNMALDFLPIPLSNNPYDIVGQRQSLEKRRPASIASIKELHGMTASTDKHQDDKKKMANFFFTSLAIAKFKNHGGAKKREKKQNLQMPRSAPCTPTHSRYSLLESGCIDDVFDGPLYSKIYSLRNIAAEFENEQKSPDDIYKEKTDPLSPSTPKLLRRVQVQEGPVKLSSQTSTNERYFFLFNDLLLVGKPKSASTFKLKERVRVSEIWLSQCIDEVTEAIIPPDRSFVIGWPTINALSNYVAAFSSTEEKELWYNALEKCVSDRREIEEQKEISIKVSNRVNNEDQNPHQPVVFNVNQKDDARTVIKMALEQFQYQNEDPNDYQLWLASKDTVPYPLIGHELPYAIKMNHTRNVCCHTHDENDNHTTAPDPNLRCHFILKKSKKGGYRVQLDINKAHKVWKNPIRNSPIINWAMSKKSVKAPYSPTEILPPGKLFGNPLSLLSTEEEIIPKQIQDIMTTLFRKGPGITGIFRKSASQRAARQLRQTLDAGKEVEIADKSAILLATVLKDFFRSLPDSIICSEIFEDMMNTKKMPDDAARVEEIKRLLQLIPRENYEIIMLFTCLLYHIQRYSDRNNMNSYNLSICVSPSIMRPPKDYKLVQLEQTTCLRSDVVSCMIDNYVSIFSADNEYLLGSESEIYFDDFAGEDSDSGTEPYTEREQSLNDGDDSEKEMEPQTPDVLFTPNSDCPFGHSDSSIATNDSDDLKLSFSKNNPPSVSLVPEHLTLSKSMPSSPIYSRRAEEFGSSKNQYDTDYENNDQNDFYQRTLLRSPKVKRELSNSSNNSAELIEHKRNLSESSDSPKEKVNKCSEMTSKRRSRNGSVRSTDGNSGNNSNSLSSPVNNVRSDGGLLPRKQVIAQPIVHHFATEYYATPEYHAPPSPSIVFHTVDKRRQPAAPSYEEHIKKTQACRAVRRSKLRNQPTVERQSVENYQPPKPVQEAAGIRTESPEVNKPNRNRSKSAFRNVPPRGLSRSSRRLENSNRPCLVHATRVESIDSPVENGRTIPQFESKNPETYCQSDLRTQPLNEHLEIKNEKLDNHRHSSSNSSLLNHKSDDLKGRFDRPSNIQVIPDSSRCHIDNKPASSHTYVQQITPPKIVESKVSPLTDLTNISTNVPQKIENARVFDTDGGKIEDSSCEMLSAPPGDVSREETVMRTTVPIRQTCNISREGRKLFRSSAKLRLGQDTPMIIVDQTKNTPELDEPTNRLPSSAAESISDDQAISLSNTIQGKVKNSPTSPPISHSAVGPFSLSKSSNANQEASHDAVENAAQTLHLKKALLTKAPKKIDQLTQIFNEGSESSVKPITVRELRRTNRKLKSEFRTFGDGKIPHKFPPWEESKYIYQVKKDNLGGQSALNKVGKFNGHYKDERDPLSNRCPISRTGDSKLNKENCSNIMNKHSHSQPSGNGSTISDNKYTNTPTAPEAYEQASSIGSLSNNSESSLPHETFSRMSSQEESYV